MLNTISYMQVILTDLENDDRSHLVDPTKINEKVKKLSNQLTPELIELAAQVVQIS